MPRHFKRSCSTTYLKVLGQTFKSSEATRNVGNISLLLKYGQGFQQHVTDFGQYSLLILTLFTISLLEIFHPVSGTCE